MDSAQQRWKLVTQEEVFNPGWFRILRKTYSIDQNPPGAPYYVLERSPFVVVVAVRDGELFLVRQYRQGTDEYYWALPAGYINGAETPLDAARREAREEVGCEVNGATLVGAIDPLPGYVKSRAFVVRCEVAQLTCESDEEEIVDVCQVTWGDALEMVRTGAIREMQAVSALLLTYLLEQHR